MRVSLAVTGHGAGAASAPLGPLPPGRATPPTMTAANTAVVAIRGVTADSAERRSGRGCSRTCSTTIAAAAAR